jgi:hypothetical protein
MSRVIPSHTRFKDQDKIPDNGDRANRKNRYNEFKKCLSSLLHLKGPRVQLQNAAMPY